jgi:UDP-GlcNAc:undecaprenyl-phosphate GlcNAc-1-phosphate transferase
MLTLMLALAASVLTCHVIVASAGWHMRYTADLPGVQPQKFHTRPVPRIGGLGLLLGLIAAGLIVRLNPADTELFWLLMLSLMPAFIGGFAEDVTRRVGPGARLLLTVITAAFAFSLVGVRFVRSDMGWFDAGLSFLPFGYMMLLFAVAGVAHAINIIDGYHGLAGGVALIILFAMGLVAQQAGDALVCHICWVTGAAIFGFLLLNYPAGRLFLGDGGAYLLGSVIALAGAMLVQRNPAVSPWFPLVLVIYPVWETLFSIIRRLLVYRTGVGEPDARHLHSLVFRRVARKWVSGQSPSAKARRNYLTTLPFWGACALVSGFAVTWSHSTRALGLLVLVFIACYCLLYWRLARLPAPARRLAGRMGRLQPQTAAPGTGTDLK